MNRWETFANTNAEFYILTNSNVDYSTPEGQEFFFKSGEKVAARSLGAALKHLAHKERALEIGCGIGRLSFPHSKVFGEVCAVDISESMLKRLNNIAHDRGVTNIKTFLPHEGWDRADSFDYAYSFIVFQHIEDMHIIEDYIRRLAVALKKKGIAQLQFDTRPRTLLYRLRNGAPDFLLPRTYRKGIRRIRRSAAELSRLFSRNGLSVIEEFNPNTHDHVFILQKNSEGPIEA